MEYGYKMWDKRDEALCAVPAEKAYEGLEERAKDKEQRNKKRP